MGVPLVPKQWVSLWSQVTGNALLIERDREVYGHRGEVELALDPDGDPHYDALKITIENGHGSEEMVVPLRAVIAIMGRAGYMVGRRS